MTMVIIKVKKAFELNKHAPHAGPHDVPVLEENTCLVVVERFALVCFYPLVIAKQHEIEFSHPCL